MLIRAFHEADTEQVVALWEACGLLRPWNDPRRDIARKLEVQRELFLVAESDGRIVGTAMAGYDGHRGWVNYLAVAPDVQRTGLARELMTEVERLLRRARVPEGEPPGARRQRGRPRLLRGDRLLDRRGREPRQETHRRRLIENQNPPVLGARADSW